jgi:hypothetical protein
MAEIEYQVDEMLFKMYALAGTSNLPEKPPVYYTDSDTVYGGMGEGDALSSAGGSDVSSTIFIMMLSKFNFFSRYLVLMMSIYELLNWMTTSSRTRTLQSYSTWTQLVLTSSQEMSKNS